MHFHQRLWEADSEVQKRTKISPKKQDSLIKKTPRVGPSQYAWLYASTEIFQGPPLDLQIPVHLHPSIKFRVASIIDYPELPSSLYFFQLFESFFNFLKNCFEVLVMENSNPGMTWTGIFCVMPNRLEIVWNYYQGLISDKVAFASGLFCSHFIHWNVGDRGVDKWRIWQGYRRDRSWDTPGIQ